MYRKKSDAVHAFRFQSTDFCSSLPTWIQERLFDGTMRIIPRTDYGTEAQLAIKLDDKEQIACHGDWVIMHEGSCSFEVTSHDTFKSTYEEITKC